ncbi:MAG: EamA family transporter [Halobacteriales archaeon]|nr:EamA family transporter [Halobacteriales archaeon]
MALDYWVILGLVGAVSGAAFQIYQKQIVTEVSSIKIAHQSNLIAVPVAAIVVPFVSSTTYLIPGLALVAVTISGAISGFSYWLLARAYETEDLSTISPLRALVPVMVAAVEPLFFPEGYNFWILLAAACSTVGIYSILIEGDWLSPVRGITRSGVQLGLLSTASLVFTILINRTALNVFGAAPATYAVYFLFFTAVATAVISVVNGGVVEMIDTVTPTLQTIPLGVFRSLLIVAGLGALYLATGTKTSILLQSGVLLAIIFGGTFLKEQYLYRRIVGGVAIVTGAVLVTVFG